jgi:hypothetical protein
LSAAVIDAAILASRCAGSSAKSAMLACTFASCPYALA